MVKELRKGPFSTEVKQKDLRDLKDLRDFRKRNHSRYDDIVEDIRRLLLHFA